MIAALGDSVTRGHGEPMLGVQAQSWAQWVAEALDLPLHNVAQDGATVAGVLREQVPRLRARAALALVWAGINDTRSVGWDAAAFERDLRAVLAAVDAERVLVATVPHELGRPRAAPKPAVAGAIVRRLAAERGAVLLDADDLAGFPLLLPDAVHLTALGQVAVADRALRALGERPRAAALADPHRGRRDALRLGARWGRLWVADVRRRAVERRRLGAH